MQQKYSNTYQNYDFLDILDPDKLKKKIDKIIQLIAREGVKNSFKI